MYIVSHYGVAVVFCVITMICWGSWANTQKLAAKTWRFQLFYWDYALGVLLWSLILAFTLGSSGSGGRGFLDDLHQAQQQWLFSAFLGGVIFNLANILLVAAIDIAGMAVAFPVGIGLALVLGVITTYAAKPAGNVPMLAIGVGCIALAVVLDALAYKKLLSGDRRTPAKGIALSVIAGVLMGFFYSFVAKAMGEITQVGGVAVLEAGKLSPYTAVVIFSCGLVASNFILNTFAMLKPFSGDPVPLGAYFTQGNFRLHLIGLIGGMIWNVGMSFSILANHAAGPALSYGLGQCATLVAALWGVFVWKEFKGAPAGTGGLLAAMFGLFIAGLGVLIASQL